jgi:N-acetyl-anhydromuramyl-L-alanine amidase AmpD
LFAEAASFLGLKYEEKENPIMTEPIHPPWFKRLSPHKSTRRAKITHIVLHNTDTSTFSSPVYWFINKNSKVSAHAIIPRNPQDSVPFSGKAGEICIPVWEKYAAWHAGVSMYNHKSLGIEIVAGGGLKGMTAWQEDTTIQLIKYWMRKYNIPRENILGHYEVKATSCPGHIWRTADDLNSWINKNF